jgi:predicted phosphoribosyltransferase
MEQLDENRAADREHAGKQLAQKFVRSHFTNGVVVGIAHGGVPVASAIAERLDLPLEVISCRTVKDPENGTSNIGSVSADEVYLHDCDYSLPQDYLYFQMVRLRNEIRYDNEFYYGNRNELDFSGKTVILVDDILTSPDTIMAAMMEISKQRPLKIIVAIPFVEAEAARQIQAQCDEFVFTKMKQHIGSPSEFYDEFQTVGDWTVRDLLKQSKSLLVA